MLSFSPRIDLHTHPHKQMHVYRYTFRYKCVCVYMCTHILLYMCTHTESHHLRILVGNSTLSSSSILETFPDKWPFTLSLNPFCLRSSRWCEAVPASGGANYCWKAEICLQKLLPVVLGMLSAAEPRGATLLPLHTS